MATDATSPPNKLKPSRMGNKPLRLANVEQIARKEPKLEKHQALHQITRDVELAIDERGRALGER